MVIIILWLYSFNSQLLLFLIHFWLVSVVISYLLLVALSVRDTCERAILKIIARLYGILISVTQSKNFAIFILFFVFGKI